MKLYKSLYLRGKKKFFSLEIKLRNYFKSLKDEQKISREQ